MKLNQKNIDAKARKIRSVVATRVSRVKGTLKDYRVFVACAATGDYSAAHATKLYQKHSLEYCEAVAANAYMR